MYQDIKGFTAKLQPGTKVLFASFPADGHFNPLTGLAMHLKSIGCDVRWYTSSYYNNKLNRMGIPHYKPVKAMDFDCTNLDVFPERENNKSQVKKLVFDIINVFLLRGPEYYTDIKALREEFEFDVMIADAAFTGIAFVREKLQVPVIGIGIFPLNETSKELPPPGLGMLPSKTYLGRMRHALLRVVADKLLFGKPNRMMKEILGSYGIDTEGHNLFDLNIQKSSLFLQSGTPGFEYKRNDLSSHIRFIGPLLPYSKKKEGKPWHHEKLRRFEKVVLVTQGTVEKDASKLLEPTLEAFKGTDYLVIATTGGHQTQELRSRYPQENILIEDFIPFDEVMPYADVYVTNGGYGGTLLGIQNQLPLVVAGVHEGKNEINARVGYFKLGVNLKTEKPKPAQIRQAVEEVLDNPVYTENVMALSDEFSQYNPAILFEKYLAQVVSGKAVWQRQLPAELVEA
ncbi:MAG TPA: nucleotide disphospho-sugar-binding domain-containing protein [Flavisolibacter sp.]|jgi:MGT family glycosyltransferase|nr:nucleotide disphospho-sugar-binding domain-containing protein [Flavisolibacter sp.]